MQQAERAGVPNDWMQVVLFGATQISTTFISITMQCGMYTIRRLQITEFYK